MNLKITVCELSDNFEWIALIHHVKKRRSDLVLLPEMPAYSWFPSLPKFDETIWQEALKAHDEFVAKLNQLAAIVISTRPIQDGNLRLNQAFCWRNKYQPLRTKYYLPSEKGFYEATWFHRKERDFTVFRIGEIAVGILICSEVMFNEWARWYGRRGAHLIFVPRATRKKSLDRWLVALRMAAIVSGSFVLSSNRMGRSQDVDFDGCGLIISPNGKVLASTSQNKPFATIDIDLNEAIRAKKTYPRTIPE